MARNPKTSEAAPPLPERLVQAFERARDLGFLGQGPLELHIAHAREFALCFEEVGLKGSGGQHPSPLQSFNFLDLGSGGGLPGLVLAERWPTSEAVLLDANARRAGFLQRTVRDLGWSERVGVIRSRAEEAGNSDALRATFGLVVARGFAAPAVTAECAAPFLRRGGLLIVSEPPLTVGVAAAAPDQLERTPEVDLRRWPPDAVAELGLEAASFWRGEFGYQAFRQITPCPGRYPRRSGIPSKRPLWRTADEPSVNP